MLTFKIPEINDKEWIVPILKESGCIGADCAFGTMFIWQEAYKIKVLKYKDFLLKTFGDEPIYSFPVGCGDIKDALNTIIKDSKEKGIPFKMMGVTEYLSKQLEEIMPGAFEFKEERDIADYIYNSTDLALLKGKKYHGKRNHIAKFEREYNWEYEEISSKNIDDCKDFCQKWFDENKDQKLESIELEKIALKKSFDNYNALDFFGGIIKVDNNIVALTMGEEINKDVFLTHFEKALTSYNGSYSIINREFASRLKNNYLYINREEDMGIEGLRKAKLSYCPSTLLKKFIAIKKD